MAADRIEEIYKKVASTAGYFGAAAVYFLWIGMMVYYVLGWFF